MRIFTGDGARRGLLAVAAAAATLTATATVAAAAPGSADDGAGAGAGAFLLTSGSAVAAVLCGPDVGAHPDPARACESIRQADGDFGRLRAEQDTPCVLIHQPTPAHAWGVWSGRDQLRTVDFGADYDNPCFAAAQSGGVFGF